MAKKEIFRTLSKLWLLNCCIVIVIIMLHLGCALAADTKEDISLQNVTAIENNSTSPEPVAEALTRYRRQPPRTIIKHIIRPKRYKMKRVKRPKIKYSFAEPPPLYYTRKPIIFKKPTFDSSLFEDFSHMNVESADFDLPPSSYETQSMDLDLYKHYEPSIQPASYKEVHKPSFYTYAEPNIREVTKAPSYTYSGPEISYQETSKPSVTYKYTSAKPRKPHTEYGVPTEFVYSTGYDKTNDNKYTYEAPDSKPVYTVVEKPNYYLHNQNEHSYNKPSKELPRIPATTYGISDAHVPATGSNDYNKYSLVEQKPIKTKTYHFAEPPQPESSVEITYSPSYEINIPSRNELSYKSGGNQTPARHPTHHQRPPISYEQPSYQEQPQYEDTPQQYDPPESAYDTASDGNYEEIAHTQQEVSGTNLPASYQPAPAKHQTIDEYIPTSEDLPINVNHQQPPYDYPKSSYEVPIYDPIPFDASNQQQREVYPPQIFGKTNGDQRTPSVNTPSEARPANEGSTPNDEPLADAEVQSNKKKPQSPRNHSRRTHKRKRTKDSSTTLSTTKHILDVPELEAAFEKENRNKLSKSPEPDAHESQRFENVNSQNNNNINDNYSKGPWNPMKIRTSPIMKVSPATIMPPTSTKNKRYHYKQQRKPVSSPTRTTTTTTTTEEPTNFQFITIEKSRSKTYYDGVAATPKVYHTNFNSNRFKIEHANTSTTPPQPHIKSNHDNQFAKRTTQNIFDTTVFKSPITDRDAYRNLPKNHKLI